MTHLLRKSRTIMGWIACGAVALFLPSAAQAQADAAVCGDYATEAVTQATKNQTLKCGFGGPRWVKDFKAHYDWCMSLEGEASPRAIEGLERIKGLKDCAARIEAMKEKGVLQQPGSAADILKETTPATPTPTPAGKPKVKVKLPVDVYDAAGGVGNKIGELAAGDEVELAGACQDNWCNVLGPAVPNGNGYVYDGPDYNSL